MIVLTQLKKNATLQRLYISIRRKHLNHPQQRSFLCFLSRWSHQQFTSYFINFKSCYLKRLIQSLGTVGRSPGNLQRLHRCQWRNLTGWLHAQTIRMLQSRESSKCQCNLKSLKQCNEIFLVKWFPANKQNQLKGGRAIRLLLTSNGMESVCLVK